MVAIMVVFEAHQGMGGVKGGEGVPFRGVSGRGRGREGKEEVEAPWMEVLSVFTYREEEEDEYVGRGMGLRPGQGV